MIEVKIVQIMAWRDIMLALGDDGNIYKATMSSDYTQTFVAWELFAHSPTRDRE